MPVDPKARVRISAFNWVPSFAQGYVRDLRVRWALEEAGVPYAVRKLDAAAERPADYFDEQPFGQVPSYRDGNISLFESGAIVLHIGRNCEVLLPSDEAAQARATAWLIAAQLSVPRPTRRARSRNAPSVTDFERQALRSEKGQTR